MMNPAKISSEKLIDDDEEEEEEEEEYPPSEDTFFLADYLSNSRPSGKMALDIGSGSGYITKMLWDTFDIVIGTDVNFNVLKNQSPAYCTENLICCNGSDAVSAKFDLAVCNPPYLATDTIVYAATDGGQGGVVVPSRILNSVRHSVRRGGRFVFISTTLSDYKGLMRHALDVGFADARIISRKKLFFEELLLIECVMGSPRCE